MKCLSCDAEIPRLEAMPEDIRNDGTLPVYGTCRACRSSNRGHRSRGTGATLRLSAPEQALYGRETYRRAVVIGRA